MGLGLLIFLIAVIAIVVVMLVNIYNRLVTGRNRYQNAYAQIDVQLRRRYDLIPNLVESVKGYMAHERETLAAVINARNSAMSASQQAAQAPGDPQAMQQLSAAEGVLTSTLGRFLPFRKPTPI